MINEKGILPEALATRVPQVPETSPAATPVPVRFNNSRREMTRGVLTPSAAAGADSRFWLNRSSTPYRSSLAISGPQFSARCTMASGHHAQDLRDGQAPLAG